MSLEAALATHRTSEPREERDRMRMLEFARTHREPFDRAIPEGHFTGSGLVMSEDGSAVLLLHHAKLHRWLQPGGHAEPADQGDMQASALREAREETGCQVHLHPDAPRPLDVDIHSIPARKDEPGHLHLDVRFLLVAGNPEALAHDPNESFGAQWLSWPEALQRADEPPLRRLLEKARAAAALKNT